MLNLIPSWAVHYEQFWNSVKRRNLWFIKLRYAAVLMLLFFLFGTKYLLSLNLTSTQFSATILITILILIYNIVIHYFRKNVKTENESFNHLHLSLLQMILDLAALTLLIYFLGTLENPLYMFYIFHMIIGSLILPGSIIYSLALIVVMVFSSLIILEYYGVIYHHTIYGFLSNPIYKDSEFILIFIAVFGIMMFMSVILANKLAKELYKREQDLIDTLRKLDEAEKAKQKYTMAVVHEIKTPMAAVQSYLNLILKNYIGSIDKEISNRLDRAKVRTEEAINLANEILQISKLRLLENITKEEVDIYSLIIEILPRYKPNADLKGIKMIIPEIKYNKNVVWGDKILLDLAFSNLIGNAVKYNIPGGTIEISIYEDNFKNVLVDICDDGIGIPCEEQDKIFKEFYRASNTKQKNLEGTGLGLSIVYQIIQNHNGKIKVISPSKLQKESRPGTDFIVSLPSEKNQL